MVGIKAGAEYRYGRESKEQTGEPSARIKQIIWLWEHQINGSNRKDVKSLFR